VFEAHSLRRQIIGYDWRLRADNASQRNTLLTSFLLRELTRLKHNGNSSSPSQPFGDIRDCILIEDSVEVT
jgi:hypothetical protein